MWSIFYVGHILCGAYFMWSIFSTNCDSAIAVHAIPITLGILCVPKKGNFDVCLRTALQSISIHCPASMTSLIHHICKDRFPI